MIPLVPRKPIGRRHNRTVLPSITSQSLVKPETTSRAANTGWRRYGIARRRELLEQDAAGGGNHFELNLNCRIQGYFALSEKIISKFNASFAKSEDIEATYVMGSRLCHFLTEALPRHPSYMKKDPVISRLREKSFQSLVHIKKKIEALALRIDEEQLNEYIMHDFDPFADDDDDEESISSSSDHLSSSLDSAQQEEPQWEDFGGWSFDLPDKMAKTTSTTMEVEEEVEFVQDISVLAVSKDLDLDESAETEDTSNETFSSSELSFQTHDDQEPIYDSYGLDFLKRIASEDVRYESDSDAEDSWDQESEVESTLYSSFSVGDTFDPARIALRELMMNKKQRPERTSFDHSSKENTRFDENQENRSLSFDLSPDNSFDDEEEDSVDDDEEEQEDIWIAFDPTKSLARAPAELERVSL